LRPSALMGVTMLFLKYDVDPEHIETVSAAFHRVCDVLRLDCDKDDDAMTEVVAMKIVERVRTGEVDPERLCIDVLAELETAPSAT
jgi:hypothetical protein